MVYSTDGAFWRAARGSGRTRVVDLLNPAAVLLPAANVIMQLASPGVGYGVLESPVDSGNVYKHPFKRARTTGTYLAGGHHRHRCRPRADPRGGRHGARPGAVDPSSPVSYNAFDPGLQLWVAACLYRYYVDQHEFLYGPLDDASRRRGVSGRQAAGHHTAGARRDVARGPCRVRRVLEAVAGRAAASTRRCASTCTGWRRWRSCPGRCGSWPGRSISSPRRDFCPPSSARMMRLDWTPSPAAPIRVAAAGLRLADRVIPHQVWMLGYRIYLWDMRFRARRGKRIV